MQRIAGFCFKHEIHFIYRCDIAETLRTAPPMVSGLDVHQVNRENLVQMKSLLTPFPPVIEARVQRGDLAMLAAQGSQWVFRSSVVLGEQYYPVTGYPLYLGPQDAYLECAETLESWRGQGVAPGMLRPTMRLLLDRGYTKALMTISITNNASCRAAEKGGAERIGLIIATRRFGRWRATGLPLVGHQMPALPSTVTLPSHTRQVTAPHGEAMTR